LSSKISWYPGTEITADEARAKRFLSISHTAALEYSWASGVATTRFLEGLKEGQLWGRECEGCHRTMIPPRMYCEACFRPTDRWKQLRDSGRVATYSVSYVNADASRRTAKGRAEESARRRRTSVLTIGRGGVVERAPRAAEGRGTGEEEQEEEEDSGPIVIAVIEIDGASPMMGMLHLLGEVSLDRLSVGLPVEAVWRPKAERQGAITDIRYFRPIDGRDRPGSGEKRGGID
jgi:uncharacterized OB-fold protein